MEGVCGYSPVYFLGVEVVEGGRKGVGVRCGVDGGSNIWMR